MPKTTGKLLAAKVARRVTVTPWALPQRPVTCTPASASASPDLAADGATSARRTTTATLRSNASHVTATLRDLSLSSVTT